MKRDLRRYLLLPTLGLGVLLSTSACGAAPMSQKGQAPSGAVPQAITANQAVPSGDQAAKSGSKPAPVKPQLIKTASMRVTVREIDAGVIALRKILTQQQGNIYNFDDFRDRRGARRRVTLVLKVPQDKLDTTLEAIGKLGNVIRTEVSSQDVTDQIVDTDARLKNLRKQEEMTQELMERSGSLKDVLAVSNQLSQVREKIERLDAQVKRLKSQVAYSTINLRMSAAIVGGQATNNSFGLKLKETWDRSTWAASQFVVGLVLFGVGLIPFLPFILLLLAGIYLLQKLIRRRWRRRRAQRREAS